VSAGAGAGWVIGMVQFKGDAPRRSGLALIF
jgi:hypothetical protein